MIYSNGRSYLIKYRSIDYERNPIKANNIQFHRSIAFIKKNGMYPISFEEDFVFFTSYIIFNNDYGSGTQEELNVMEVVQKK